jgi:[ribosomal protein S5]-alanine N-acetyltransferase
VTAPILRGERVELRLPDAREAAAVTHFVRRNRDHLGPWEPVRPSSYYTEAHWRAQLRANRRDARAERSLRLYVFERARPDRVVGIVTLSNFVRGAFQACHLGFSIDHELQGRGLMSEAVRLALDHAFGPLNFHRVMANHMPGNARSARLLRRLGFRVEGRAREYLLIDGRWRDHVLTSLVRRGWKPRPSPPLVRPKGRS